MGERDEIGRLMQVFLGRRRLDLPLGWDMRHNCSGRASACARAGECRWVSMSVVLSSREWGILAGVWPRKKGFAACSPVSLFGGACVRGAFDGFEAMVGSCARSHSWYLPTSSVVPLRSFVCLGARKNRGSVGTSSRVCYEYFRTQGEGPIRHVCLQVS